MSDTALQAALNGLVFFTLANITLDAAGYFGANIEVAWVFGTGIAIWVAAVWVGILMLLDTVGSG